MNASVLTGRPSVPMELRLSTFVVAAGVSALSMMAGAVVVTPRGWIAVAGLGAVAAGVALILASPEVALLGSVIVFGTYQFSDLHPIHAASISLYSTDLLLGALLVRALLPRDRLAGSVTMHPLVKVLAAAAALAFVYADWRGRQSGLPLRSLVRTPIALFYVPLYTFAFSRLLRERTLDHQRLYRFLGGAVLGFVLIMLASRAAGKTFDSQNSFSLNSNGYKVVTADGTLLRRDYGFPSAFILYPLIAFQALAFAVYGKTRSNWAILLVVAGCAATFLTLIRGEIFGLILGVVVLYFIVPKGQIVRGPRRAQSLAVVLAAITVGAVIVTVASPALATGLAERTLPGILSQGTYAQKTASDRVQALSVGYQQVLKHPAGIGFRDSATLAADTQVDPLFVTHSTLAWLFVFMGWPGLLAVLGLMLASAIASFVVPAREAWHHPAFVASASFFFVYSFSTFGLVGQQWVIGVTALLVALRFTQVTEDAT
jgi:hypothetical protein